MMKFWGDTEYHCRNRYGLWVQEIGVCLFMFAGASFAPNPLILWSELVFFMAAFNVLAIYDRRRWKFHQALNRLTQPDKQWPWDYYTT